MNTHIDIPLIRLDLRKKGVCVKFMLNPMGIHTTPESFSYLCRKKDYL